MEAKDKKIFINCLRGVAIFLMLYGHCIQYMSLDQFDFFENTAFKIIYSFHMPLFMLISGYLFFFSSEKKSFSDLIVYKAQSLLYPILMCSILNYLLTNGITFAFKLKFFSIHMGSSIFDLWFLWSVLSASIAMSIAVKVTKKRIIQAILIIFGIFIAFIFPQWELNVYMYPYFVIGYLLARNEEKIKSFFIPIGIIGTVAFITMLFFFKKEHYIYTTGLTGGNSVASAITIDFFRWAIGLFGSICITFLLKMIFIFFKKNNLIIRFLTILGENSLAVYALSVSLLSFWLPRICNSLFDNTEWINWNNCIWLYNLIITPILACAYAVFILLIIKLLKKIKAYRLIFGR